MTLQTIPGEGLWIPEPPRFVFNFGFSNMLIDATGEKVAFIGRVWNKDRGSKDITKVGFRFGTVVKAGGSALIVSLQNVSLTTAVIQPDETQDQTVAIANANASFASNTWIQTGALSANRTVTFGELLAVVVEFDGGGRLGSDTVNISGLAGVETGTSHASTMSHKTGGAWAISTLTNNIILEFTDGTFGTLDKGYPASAVTTTAFNSDTAGADEYAMEFTLPFPVKVDGAYIYLSITGTSSDFDVVLYDGTTAMTGGTVSIDAHSVINTGNQRILFVPFTAEISLTANTTYRLALKPTTANSVTLLQVDVSANGHFQAWAGGTAWNTTSRVDAGSWAAVTATRRPLMGIRVSACDDGVGGGGTSAYTFS